MKAVVLAGEVDFDGFRRAARALLAADTAPDAVRWSVADSAEPGLFADEGARVAASGAAARVPAEFLTLCRHVVCHREPGRFDLLYRLLWRLQHEPALRDDVLDPDRAQARLMAQAVSRDMHKMTAFVRFRQVPEDGEAEPLHMAWFEPDHHIVDATAPFFQRRFAGMRWAILTPQRSVRWDGRRLHVGPGAQREDAPPADAGEALWLTYYQSIFNPARLKLKMMEKEMPRRYWHNLPEARLISTLAAQAAERSTRMVDNAPTLPARRVVPGGVQRAPIPIQAEVIDARTLSAAERDAAWRQQRAAASACRDCPLAALATQTVWGEGPVGARLMLVGEQPGDQEDLRGEAFVGPAGQLLNRAMVQLDWDRSIAYVTNAVKHFKYEPRGKRRVHKTPAQREAEACAHWLESEIALVQPQALVALGGTAARQLLGRPVAVLSERGQWFRRADGLPVLVTVHPAALLRGDPPTHEAEHAAWLADLRLADVYAKPLGVAA